MTNIDDSGNITTDGSVTVGSTSLQAGQIELPQGTAPTALDPNTFNLLSPPSIPSAYAWTVPSAQGTGFLYNDGTGQLSYQIPTGTGGGTGGSSSIGPGACVYNSVSQVIPANSSSNSKLTFDTVKWDTGGFHTAPTKLTAPSAGFYLVQVSVIANSSASFNLSLSINGVTPVPSGASQGIGGGSMWTAVNYSTIIQLNAGDYVEVNTYSVGGYTTAIGSSIFQMTKLSATF